MNGAVGVPRRASARTHWKVTRQDLAAGGGEIVRLVHPLLPEFSSGHLSGEGLRLGPAVPAPGPLPLELSRAGRGAYLVRLLGLAAFLRSRGLGISPADVSRIGARPEDATRPCLGAAPVPEWRSAPPGLVLAAVALRMGGAGFEGQSASEVETEVEEALELSMEPSLLSLVRSARLHEEAGRRPEALLSEIARREGVGAEVGPDLLGLVYPEVGAGEDAGHDHPVSTAGPAALFLGRGAARRRPSKQSFLEVSPAAPLEEGSSLRRLARLLGSDPRARAIRALASGSESAFAVDGPPVSLLALAADSWDPRSRSIWGGKRGWPGGLHRFETRERPVPPWEIRSGLGVRVGVSEVAALVWLPLPSLSEGMALWERLARYAGGDLGRLLAAARQVALGFDPSHPASLTKPLLRLARAARKGDPVLDAAAVLSDDFSAQELAVAAGVGLSESQASIQRGLEWGRLVEGAPSRFRFEDSGERVTSLRRLSLTSRRDAVARLHDGSLTDASLADDRLIPAAMARGEPEDLARARSALSKAFSERDAKTCLMLLRRAPPREPDLSAPLVALIVFGALGTLEEARAAALRLDPSSCAGAPLAERLAAARRLVRLGETDRALALVESTKATLEVLARARVLLEAHREADAERLLLGLKPEGARELTGDQRAELWLLHAEAAERRHDYRAAAAALGRVRRLLDESGGSDELAGAALTAGFLASDMGRTEEAMAFFRRARELARDDGARADAGVDLAVAALHGGRIEEAERELEGALAIYGALGDRDRYLSALGNRADLNLLTGDYEAARSDLERVLSHDRAPGRDHQFLFSVTTRQRLALLDGEDSAAAEIFHEALARKEAFYAHPARREALVLEAARLLARREPGAAVSLLVEAARIPDNRLRTEPLRQRLLVSAAIDAGEAPPVSPDISPGERLLLSAEARLARGEGLLASLCRALEQRAVAGPGAAEVASRLLEWTSRFPSFFATGSSEDLLKLGSKAAVKAGLSGAAARLQGLLRVVSQGASSGPVTKRAPSLSLSLLGGASVSSQDRSRIVAEDDSTRAVFDMARRIAGTGLPFLILGETGTGKEVVARELHRLSGRSGPFVAINVASLSGSLIESELFGHARGAFTGADSDRMGLVEASSKGTLFLDEIGDLPPALQAKLLRVLQEHEVRRVGELKDRHVDLRVVSATHRDLEAMVGAGAFRADLYHRLQGARVVLRPLRERPKDLAVLVSRLLGTASLSTDARRAVMEYGWPGNVRELASALESARVLSAPSGRIELSHLPGSLGSAEVRAAEADRERKPYRQAVRDARARAIRDALESCGGNRTRAALHLGLSRQSLLYEMKKLEIE